MDRIQESSKIWVKKYKRIVNSDNVLKNQKLNSFLSQFKQVALDYLEKQKTNPKLEKLFTEIADLLSIIIEQISNIDEKTAGTKEPDIRGYVKNLLQSIELILKDTELRNQLQSSSILLTQLVMMLNNIDDEDIKIILIKLLGVLSKSFESKVLIGKNDGFKKLLALMLEQNEDILKGIIDTFKQLLDIGMEKEQEMALSAAIPAPKLEALGDIGTVSAEEIRSIFEREGEELSPGPNRGTTLRIPKSETGNRVSYEVLQRMSMEIKKEQDSLAKDQIGTTSELGKDKETGEKQAEKRNKITCVTLFKNYENEKMSKPFEESKGDSIAEQMVLQGTLNTVCDILLETRHELQIELMMIIAKLLVKSKYNQTEFRKIEGYYVLAVMLNQKRDYLDENERKYLKICMQILKKIIFCDDEEKIIKNFEAFKVLLSLISTSPQLMTVMEATSLLKEILSANVRNCLILIKMLGTVDLHVLMSRVLFPESEYDHIMKMQEGLSNPNSNAKIISLYKFQQLQPLNAEVQGASKINEKKLNSLAISEKEKMEIFNELDNLLLSLSNILNPLHIIPSGSIYSQILGCKLLNLHFCVCILDRLDYIIKEKITKSNLSDYDNIYSSDLDIIIYKLSIYLHFLYTSSSLDKTLSEQLFVKALDIYHRYLLFAAALDKYAKKQEINCMQEPKNNVHLTFSKFPDVLNFFYSLAKTAYEQNPYYKEMLYSIIECLISASLSYPPVIEFIYKLITTTEKLQYQDLVLLHSICRKNQIMEGITKINKGEILKNLYNKIKEESKIENKLYKMLYIYILCISSIENKIYYESIIETIPHIKSLNYKEYNEQQQYLILIIYHNLINSIIDPNYINYIDLDLSILTYNVDIKDIELSYNIYNDIRNYYNSLTLNCNKYLYDYNDNNNNITKLLNIFIILLLDSSPSIQIKIINRIIQENNISYYLSNTWMHMEIIDTLLETYNNLLNQNDTLRNAYLKLISIILTRGVSLTKIELFYKLFKNSQEFQCAILDCLENDNPNLYLHLQSPQKDYSEGYLFTYPFKSDSKGFSISFWIKYPLIENVSRLFEITSPNEKETLVSYNYIICPPITVHAGASSSSLSKKEEDSSLGSARGNKDDTTKYLMSIDTESNTNKIELSGPLIEENVFTHICIYYGKSIHYCYINGKIIYSSKQNIGYPMASFKKLRLRFNSQEKCIAAISIMSEQTDAEAIMGLYLKGPSDESGINAKCLYRFPRAIPMKSMEVHYEKLCCEQETAIVEIKREYYKINNTIASISNEQAQYFFKLRFFPDNEYISPSIKELKNPALYETFGTIKVTISHNQTLKEYLSSKEFFEIILDKLIPTRQKIIISEATILLKIIEKLLIYNIKFNEIIRDKVNRVLLSLAICYKQRSSDIGIFQLNILSTLINIWCNQQNITKILNTFTKPSIISIPVLHNSRMEILKYVKWISLNSPNNIRECFLCVLANLLQRQENMEKLAISGLQITLTFMFYQTFENKTDSNLFAYEKLLEVFQSFFLWHHTIDWEHLFSFFISLDNNEASGKRHREVLVDLLSTLSIYIFVIGNRNGLSEKFIAKDGIKMIYQLFKSTNIEVVEHSIKLLSTVLHSLPNIKQNALYKMRLFELMQQRLANKIPTFSFLQSLCDFIIGSITFQSLCPQSDSYVSAIINRSQIANDVIKQNSMLSQSGIAASSVINLLHPEALEILFSALTRTKELHYRINMLRQLQNIFYNEQDSQKAIDVGIFIWIVEYFKSLDIELSQASKSEQQSELSIESLKKISKMSLKLVCDILVVELEKKDCKILSILQSIPSSIDYIQCLVLDRLFKIYFKQPTLKKNVDYTIKNLSTLLNNLHAILSVTDDIKFKIVRVINGLASKNTKEIRDLMKSAKLFELRDNLLIDIINSKIGSNDFINLLQQINIDALANNPKFRDSKTIEILIASVIESQENDIGHRKEILNVFQKQICKWPENIKYITKAVEDSVFIEALTGKIGNEAFEKYLKEKKTEIKQNLKRILVTANDKRENSFIQQKKAAEERSNKRNKKQAEIAKERGIIQAQLADFENQESKFLLNVGSQVINQILKQQQEIYEKEIETYIDKY